MSLFSRIMTVDLDIVKQVILWSNSVAKEVTRLNRIHEWYIWMDFFHCRLDSYYGMNVIVNNIDTLSNSFLSICKKNRNAKSRNCYSNFKKHKVMFFKLRMSKIIFIIQWGFRKFQESIKSFFRESINF